MPIGVGDGERESGSVPRIERRHDQHMFIFMYVLEHRKTIICSDAAEGLMGYRIDMFARHELRTAVDIRRSLHLPGVNNDISRRTRELLDDMVRMSLMYGAGYASATRSPSPPSYQYRRRYQTDEDQVQDEQLSEDNESEGKTYYDKVRHVRKSVSISNSRLFIQSDMNHNVNEMVHYDGKGTVKMKGGPGHAYTHVLIIVCVIPLMALIAVYQRCLMSMIADWACVMSCHGSLFLY